MKTYGLEQDWHSTSSLYEKYKILLDKNTKPVSYRRFSELLKDLENTGLVISNTSSKGRNGYSSEFKLAVSPETVGTIIAKEWWQKNVVEKKKASKILKIDYKTIHYKIKKYGININGSVKNER